MGITLDLVGKRFGKLLVIKRLGVDKNRKVKWLCECDCGKTKSISGRDLVAGKTTSCGCYRKEIMKGKAIRHNMHGTRPYSIWNSMKNRCCNKRSIGYKHYGGRGIKVCSEWQTFNGFWKDMQEGYSDNLTIERIDVNGNYEKSNCKWASMKEQANNTTRNRRIEYNGEMHNILEWSNILDIHINTLRQRLNRGWSVEDAFTIKPDKGRNQYSKSTQ